MTTRLESGQTAPDFSLPTADGRTVSLADHKGRSVILYFYPAAMTPGCTIQAVDFTAHNKEFTDAGYNVIGISPDSPDRLAMFRDKENLDVTLLADPERKALDAYGAYGEKMLYGKAMEGVIRSTFVIDVDDTGKGTIRDAMYNVKAAGHVEKLKRDLKI